jgi:hypothetical protein
LLVWTTTGATSLAVNPERIKAAPMIWTGTSLSPASQYPKRVAKTGSVVSIIAAEIRRRTKVCTKNAPADPNRHVTTRESQTSRGGKATGSKRGQSSPKANAIESI